MLLALAACTTKKGDELSSDPVERAQQEGTFKVGLERVSTDKCLNVEKYFATIRTFPTETKVRKMTTDFRMRAGYNLPRNFYLRLAAGNFQILDTEISQVPDFAEMKQTDCDSVVMATEGHSETYKVVSAKKDSITFKNEWGGDTTVTWTSPTSIQFDVTSVVGDYLCDANSQGKLTVTQQINWGDSSILTESLSENTISSSFLSLVSQATGYSMNSLYTAPATTEMPPADGAADPSQPHAMADNSSPNVDRRLVVSRLKELQALPVRSELTQCY